jgi:hypothetical protein
MRTLARRRQDRDFVDLLDNRFRDDASLAGAPRRLRPGLPVPQLSAATWFDCFATAFTTVASAEAQV